MWIDPIVQEVRDAGAELARRANYDLRTFFKNLRDNEKKRNAKVVSRYAPVDRLEQANAAQDLNAGGKE